MRKLLRWSVVLLVGAHGLIHLMGAVKGLGWADIAELREPISTSMGLVWLAVALVVLSAAVVILVRPRGWWLVTGAAALASQAVVLTSWQDANAGTVANVFMLAVAAYGFAADGPRSLRTEYRRGTAESLEPVHTAGVLTEAHLAGLPPLVAAYVRRSGAVGRPRVGSFRAQVSGRIRSGPDSRWMPFTGEQVNTYGAQPTRLFLMDATMLGLPVDVFHAFTDGAATMRGRLCSVLPVVTASGADMTRAETVTLFNDLCVMAPAAIVDAPVSFEQLDDHRVRGRFTLGEHSVGAVLSFNEDGDLVNFVSEDRLRAGRGGKTFIATPWSTPVGRYAQFGGRRVATLGEAVWTASEPEGRFPYLQFVVEDIEHNVGADRVPPRVGFPRRSVRSRGSITLGSDSSPASPGNRSRGRRAGRVTGR